MGHPKGRDRNERKKVDASTPGRRGFAAIRGCSLAQYWWNPTLDFVTQFPLLKPLDLSDAICRTDVCRPVEGNVLIYHGAHHLSPTYMRTMVDELGRQIAANTGWW